MQSIEKIHLFFKLYVQINGGNYMLDFSKYTTKMRNDIDFEYAKQNYPKTYEYWLFLEKSLLKSIEDTNSENFWETVKKLIAIDSKFILVSDLLKYDFTDMDILNLVEKDYYSLNKELCGYNLNQIPHNSIFFLELFWGADFPEFKRVF